MKTEYQNIIIRMPNWLGDAVMATPIIADLKKRWPQATLTAMCQGKPQSGVGALLIGNPHLDEIFSFTCPNEFLHRITERGLIERIRQGKYDLGILLPNSFSSAWWFWRGGVTIRMGFATDFRSFLLSKALPIPKMRGQEHLVKTYKRLLEPLGIPISNTEPSLYVMDEERRAVKQLLHQYSVPKGATLIGINPGAAYGSAKCWPPERFRSLIEKLMRRPNTYILCFADPQGAELVDGICKELPSNVINLAAATTLRELIAFIEQCSVFLTNDSGPMHIAAALKRPLVALFGSTNEIATGPYGGGEVIHKHVPCSPCYRRTCPIDFPCMKLIGVDEVYNALVQQLNSR